MYKAKVVKLSVKPHPNADRLQLGYVNGIQVIVGLDAKDGDIGAFFPCDGQLSNEFLSMHNLYRHSELNSDKSKSGYFSDNGRVTVEKIRNERSDGFFCPLSYFEYTGFDIGKLKVGDEFDKLNGHKICGKYYTPATLKAMNKKSGLSKPKMPNVEYNLPRHFDTGQLQYNIHDVELGDLVIVTEKAHGTSTRIGNVLVEREIKLKWWQKLYNLLPFPNYPDKHTGYEFVVGSRNRVVDPNLPESHPDYYRLGTAKQLNGKLKKGEIVYAEIVGFTTTGKPIMNQQGTSKLPEIRKRYGEVMTYTYGCAWNSLDVPAQKLFVYRITQVNDDGYEIDLPWTQVKRRAQELGLECVPEIDVDLFYNNDNFLEDIEGYVVGNSLLDFSHIREGVCVRLEKRDGTTKVYKHKSFEFKVLEGILKNSDDYVDTEEVA